MMESNEKRFEQDIETSLITEGGYTKGSMTAYDKELALNVDELVAFIQETQPKQWDRYKTLNYTDPKEALAKRFDQVVKEQGLLEVLRNGFKDRGVSFQVVYFRPETSLNEKASQLYEANRLQAIRQFYFNPKTNESIDLVLMLNGIPIVGLELKNQLTGQSIDHGKKQWSKRNKYNKVFHFNERFLVYFATDLYNVAMTTEVKGDGTNFLPYNQGTNGPGNDGGAGNPQNTEGYMTSYLWETILERHSLLMILQRFFHLEIKRDKKGNKTGEALIFPRYHQYDVVEKMVRNARRTGPRENYLIQHSAGSGKSYSIAWLAYRLSTLHNQDNAPIYNSVIVVSDRRVLDKQLQETIKSIDHTEGVIAAIDEGQSSKDLQAAIESGRKIIITTLQKFPHIVEKVDSQAGRNFAVIVDEAHASQSGKSAHQMKASLSDIDYSLEEIATIENQEEENREDDEDKIARIMASQGKQENLSFFGFTATPKQETLEVFGKAIEKTEQEAPAYRAHHVYSMRQAIEEGFIFDVLQNYMTYDVSYRIANSTKENPEVPQSKAAKTIAQYAFLHPRNISEKTEVMVEHFMLNTRHKINGKGKAMVVTPSRLHAVRYFKEFQRYINRQGYEDDIGVLVAFSGKVLDSGLEETETTLNKGKDGRAIKSNELPNAFSSSEFNIIIVAEKFQTGFDQPLLHTMYVDKPLNSIRAVQTLSRLNRIATDKKDTFVLDFVNDTEDIQKAFEPYFQQTELEEGTDVNSIYALQHKIREYGVYNSEDVTRVVTFYFDKKKQTAHDLGILAGMYRPMIHQYDQLNADQRYEFRVYIRRFIKAYSYITQIVQLFDRDLEVEFTFLQQLNKLLPKETVEDEYMDIKDKLEMEFYKLEQIFEGNISLNPDSVDYQLSNPKLDRDALKEEEPKNFLNDIIEVINERYHGEFTGKNRVQTDILSKEFMANESLRESAKRNNENIYINNIFDEAFDQSVMENFEKDREKFESLYQDGELYENMKEALARFTYKMFRNAEEV